MNVDNEAGKWNEAGEAFFHLIKMPGNPLTKNSFIVNDPSDIEPSIVFAIH